MVHPKLNRPYVMTENPIGDSFYAWINKTGARVGLYSSDVHYIRSLLQSKFNRDFTLEETYAMLVEEYPDFNFYMNTYRGYYPQDALPDINPRVEDNQEDLLVDPTTIEDSTVNGQEE